MRCSLLVVSITLASLLGSSGCGKNRKGVTGGGIEGAGAVDDAQSALAPENYKPPVTYSVDSYEVDYPSIQVLSPFLDPTPKATAGTAGLALRPDDKKASLQLADGTEATFRTGFPMTINFGMKVTGNEVSMGVTFGLIRLPDNGVISGSYRDLPACPLGTETLVHGGSRDGTAGLQTYSVTYTIPDSCLDAGKPAHMVLYIITNIDGAVQPKSGEARQFAVLDKTSQLQHGACLKLFDTQTDCTASILVSPPPAPNVRLTNLKMDSAYAVLPAENPTVSYANKGSLPLPLASATAVVSIDGLSDQPADLAAYKVRVNYSICAGLALKPSSSTCDGTLPWQPLNALQGDLSGSDLSQLDLYQEMAPASSREPLTFSAPLHAVSSVYALMNKSGGAAWSNTVGFSIRACATLYKDGQEVTQANLDSQAVGGDPKADDCLVFPVVVADARSDQTATCGTGGSSLMLADCTSNFAEEQSLGQGAPSDEFNLTASNTKPVLTGATAKTPTYLAQPGWNNGWGDINKFRMEFKVSPTVTADVNALRATFGVASNVTSYFFSTSLFNASMTLNIDISGGSDHYYEPNLGFFGSKIFGSKNVIQPTFQYVFPIKNIAGSDTSKTKKNTKIKSKKTIKAPADRKSPPTVETELVTDIPNSLYVKESCSEKTIRVNIVSITAKGCVEGGLYLNAGFYSDVRAPGTDDQDKFAGGNGIAAVGLNFAPGVGAGANAYVAAGLAGLIRGGIQGDLRVIDVGVPLSVAVRAGTFMDSVAVPEITTKTGKVAATTKAALGVRFNAVYDTSVAIDWLSGRIFGFFDYKWISWCESSHWWVPDYPCLQWNRAWEKEFASFGGGGSAYSIYQATLKDQTLRPSVVLSYGLL